MTALPSKMTVIEIADVGGPELLKPVVGARIPFREAAKAHALMESGNYIGKNPLTM